MADLKTYWLSFRIKEDATGQERRDALYDYIDDISDEYWDSTTSFLIFDSKKTIQTICAGLARRLRKTTDQFVIRYMSKTTGYYWGKIDDVDTLVRLTGFDEYS